MISRDLLHRKIETILPRVEKPYRYLGNEVHAIRKPAAEIELRWALVFPEVYEIGMSWTGQQILYHLLNAHPGTAAERAYAFWPDMEALLREEGIPAFSLETWTPLAEFDIIGFTLQYELVFTNLLALLDLAGIPLRGADRGEAHPLIVAGGPVAFNCEPIADFLDAVVLGDGEDAILEITEIRRAGKRAGISRRDLLRRLAQTPGVYVPSLYSVEYEMKPVAGWEHPAIRSIQPLDGAPSRVRRRWVEDLNRVPFPATPLVPLGGTVHDRLGIEVQRGCTRACRFCQAGYVYRPERQRDPRRVPALAEAALQATGHDEISLLSLSIGDYGCLDALLDGLTRPAAAQTLPVAVSLPSIRVDTLTEAVADRIATVRKTGFTMAPEAGSARLRALINKALSEDQIAAAAELVFRKGWRHIKFYYMIGLPTETDDDLLEIVRAARRCQAIGRKYTRAADIHVSVSTFIPKPFTPLQWEPQIPAEEIVRRQRLLRDALRKTGLTFRWHESRESVLEAVLSRGDRRLGDVVERAFRLGARFDGWREHFREEAWAAAFQAAAITPGFYANRRIPIEETLPWEHLDCGVAREWLARDYHNALHGRHVPHCASGRCYLCGVCDFERIKNRTYIPAESPSSPPAVVVVEEQEVETGKPRGRGAGPEVIAIKPPLTALSKSKAALSPTTSSAAAPSGTAASAVASEEFRRFRVRFAKEGRAAYLGHLDLMATIARAFKRAGVPVIYSRGFHPQPRFSFGPALMTGIISRFEYFDVDIAPPTGAEASEGTKPDSCIERVNAGLPEGLRLLCVEAIPTHAPSLGVSIIGARYEVTERFPGDFPPEDQRVERLRWFLAAPSVEIQNERKRYDVRPHVNGAGVIEGGFRVELQIAPSRPGARPTDVVRAILDMPDPLQARRFRIVKTETTFSTPR